MVKKKEYTAEDIKVLDDRSHVRLRTQIYLGNMNKVVYNIPLFVNDKIKIKEVEFIPAVYKAVGEIIDNSIDEFANTTFAGKVLSIDANPVLGTYTISDNGRGVPIDMHSSGKHTPEVVFGSLRSGRNFTDDKEAGVIGMNGVGSACTNYCSVEFSVDIHRDGKRYRQTFSNGATEISKPSIRAGSDKTGTSISFQLDSEVFEDPTLPPELMQNRAIELALTNPGLTVEYNGEKYKYKNGFETIVSKISNDNYFKFEQDGYEFYVVFNVQKGLEEQIFSWVNSSLLFDGGICNTQFLNAFFDRVINHLAKEAKKAKCEVTKNDVRANLLVLGNHKIKDPEYDAQSKTRLTGPNRRLEMGKMIDDQWQSFTRKNKEWFAEVFDRAVVRFHEDENRKAIKDHIKKSKKVVGLVDATSDNRFETKLLITEGDSAASMITDSRDPEIIASLPLSGKVNNVWGATPAQLLNMGKITDMLTAIGLVPGQKAVRSSLRYGQVIISTDADYDGSDIFTLLINLFFSFWPELFDPNYDPFIYRMVAPNVVASKGGKRVHFTTRTDFENVKDKYKGWTVEYMKGLGSMSKGDWDIVIAGLDKYSIPIVDDGEIASTLELLFGPSAELRREWLQKTETV